VTLRSFPYSRRRNNKLWDKEIKVVGILVVGVKKSLKRLTRGIIAVKLGIRV